MTHHIEGLFERWMALELATGRQLSQILDDLNAAAGTAYKHNWPSVVASRNYELERSPLAVRRYMMQRVLQDELRKIGVTLPQKQLDELIFALT